MSRIVARDILYKLVFEFLFSNEINDKTFEILTLTSEIDSEDKEYILSMYKGIVDEYDELIFIIDRFSEKFTSSRMVKSDISALLIAIYEMKNRKDIPNTVSINEAVDLVKKYSTEKSGTYVNGILSSYYKDIN